MPKSSALAMWSVWLAAALLHAAAAAPPRHAKLLPRDRQPQRTLDRAASELAWRNWLQSPENKDPAVPPRRITPKSVFITPHHCPEGKRLNGEDCINVQQVGKEVHETYILQQLNDMSAPGGVLYDYEDAPAPADTDEPLQLNLPLGAALSASASQNVPSRLPPSVYNNYDKKDSENTNLEVELLKLKEINKKENQTPITNILGEISKTDSDKPKRDNDDTRDTVAEEQGQKEVIYGHVGEDTYQYVTKNQTKDDSPVIITTDEHTTSQTTTTDMDDLATERTVSTTTSEPTTTTYPTEATTENAITTTLVAHNLKENEKPTKLHPEIDYSDIGEAVKLISRYADVSTDDMFADEQKKTSAEEGQLGTRTKQQHRKKQKPLEAEPGVVDGFPGLYPPPPPPPAASVYADRVPGRIAYKAPAYYAYPAYPAPPPDYPFRHVQQYWARPELLLGPYAAGNPRRHHHSARRPPRDPSRPPGARHWFSYDAAER